MEATLFCFVFHVYLTSTLVIQQYLPKDQFEVVINHVIACARNFIIAQVREVKRSAVTMAGLRSRINIAAPLQIFDIFLCAQNRGDIETIMRQVIAL